MIRKMDNSQRGAPVAVQGLERTQLLLGLVQESGVGLHQIDLRVTRHPGVSVPRTGPD